MFTVVTGDAIGDVRKFPKEGVRPRVHDEVMTTYKIVSGSS